MRLLALAEEAALHVGERADDRVDRAGLHLGGELLERQHGHPLAREGRRVAPLAAIGQRLQVSAGSANSPSCRASSAASSSSVPIAHRALEPVSGRDDPPAAEAEADADEPEDRVVRQRPGEVRRPRQPVVEERHAEEDGDHRHPAASAIVVDPLVVPPEAPRPVLEAVAEPEPQEHGQDERDVEPDHGDRRPGRIADEVVPDRRHHQQRRRARRSRTRRAPGRGASRRGARTDARARRRRARRRTSSAKPRSSRRSGRRTGRPRR